MLNKLSPILAKSKFTVLQLYVRSILSYADLAWGSLIFRITWQKIEAIQNIGFLTITGLSNIVLNLTVLSSIRSPSIEEYTKRCSKTIFHKKSFSHHIRNFVRLDEHIIYYYHMRPFEWSSQSIIPNITNHTF